MRVELLGTTFILNILMHGFFRTGNLKWEHTREVLIKYLQNNIIKFLQQVGKSL
jgi:hypothetical protein